MVGGKRFVRDFGGIGQNPRPDYPAPPPPPPPPPLGGRDAREAKGGPELILPRLLIPEPAESFTGEDWVKVPAVLLKGLVRSERSAREIARRAYVRGFVHCLKTGGQL